MWTIEPLTKPSHGPRAAGSALALAGLVMTCAPQAALAEPQGPANADAPSPPVRVLTLAQVQESALAQQPQVLVARAQTSAAEAQAYQARSPLLPQVTATAQYTRETGNYVTRPGFVPPSAASGAAGAAGGTTGYSLSNSYDVWNF